MNLLIVSAIAMISWAVFIIRAYYTGSLGGPNHLEYAIPQDLVGNALIQYTTPLSTYLASIFVVYALYKVWTLLLSPRDTIQYGALQIVGFSLLHLFILCVIWFMLPEAEGNKGAAGLFLGIVMYLLYPVVLILLTRTAGFSLLSWIIPSWRQADIRIRLGVETTIGFVLFVTMALIAGLFGLFHLVSLIAILLILAGIGFTGWRDTWDLLTRTWVSVENHRSDKGLLRMIHPYLLSGEFLFLVVTFLMSVAFISIYRPMPIGWDDLGVYMNFPKIMALSGELLQGSGYTAWQIVTATGFLFGNNATQAFFVNQIGGILSVIALILTGSYFFTRSDRRYFIALPLLIAAIWYALPMIIFQQAKDMKLDPALFFFSISGVAALLGYWADHFSTRTTERDEEKKSLFTEKEWLIFIGVIGVIVGFAFTVKLTSLMFIIGGVAFLSYRFLGLSGFFGFVALWIAIFTRGNLWSMMNVSVPTTNHDLIAQVALISGVIGVGLYAYAFSRVRSTLSNQYLRFVGVFVLGIILPLIPWTVKHVIEIGGAPTSIGQLMGGSGATAYNTPDWSLIHSSGALQQIKASQAQTMTSSGQSQNEDFGRYFGYETGVNNYLKLAPNLTFQKNQTGEFTDITYIFLALLPVLFLFARGRTGYPFFIGGGLFLLYLYWFASGVPTKLITEILGGIGLPLGYLVILAPMIVFILGMHFLLTDTLTNRRIQHMSVFLALYVFIFVIAAFGIVWYGIVMYYGFLILMGLLSLTFVEYDSTEEKEHTEQWLLKAVISGIFFVLVALYFWMSSFPHGWSNLRSSYYAEYKAGKLTQESAIFKYRSDYLDPLAAMNLRDPQQAINTAIAQAQSPQIQTIFSGAQISTASQLHQAITQIQTMNDPAQTKGATYSPAIDRDIRAIGQSLYTQILYPTRETGGMGGIYRIGTFMTYFIYENRARYFDDSLVMLFEDYMYTPDPDETIDRIKKLGFEFFLIDLNAATIDKDPRHKLTTRFNHLLSTMTASGLELVSTDNQCLRVAMDAYRRGAIDQKQYMYLGGVNYESYETQSGQTIRVSRDTKRIACYNYILEQMTQDADFDTHYPYLSGLRNYLKENNITNDPTKLGQVLQQYIGSGWFALFRVK